VLSSFVFDYFVNTYDSFSAVVVCSPVYVKL